MSVSWQKRLWDGIDITMDQSCWEWKKSCENGYGRIGINGKLFLTHRLVYSIVFGDPGKLKVLHRCDNPPCCRPDHLFIGTQKQNVQDMLSKGRNISHCGILHGNSKLSESEVISIRNLYDTGSFSYSDLSDTFGVHKTVIGDIIHKNTWRHI